MYQSDGWVGDRGGGLDVIVYDRFSISEVKSIDLAKWRLGR